MNAALIAEFLRWADANRDAKRAPHHLLTAMIAAKESGLADCNYHKKPWWYVTPAGEAFLDQHGADTANTLQETEALS